MDGLSALIAFLRSLTQFLAALGGLLKAKPLQATLVALVVVMACAIGLFKWGPILLQKDWPIVRLNFPLLPEVMTVPESEKAILPVLFQRKVLFLDRWKISAKPNECEQRPNECDETHVFESWTVLVKDHERTPLLFRTFVGGDTQSGRQHLPMALTNHRLYVRDNMDNKTSQLWAVDPDPFAEGGTDLILIKRDVVGGYQPTTASTAFSPDIAACEEDGAGMDIHHPTGRAEFMLVTSEEVPPIALGSARVFAGPNNTKPKTISVGEVGEAKILDKHRIYWRIRPEYLAEMAKKRLDVALFVVWRWEKRITQGPVCGGAQAGSPKM